MSSENNELREDELAPLPKQIWQSVYILQSKYGNSDTNIRLIEQGETVSKPQVRQVIAGGIEFVRSDNLSQAAFKESNQYGKAAKAEEVARALASQQLHSAWALDEMRKIASPEKTFANHAIWTAPVWNAFEERCDVCRGSGQLRCSACGGNPRKRCMGCNGRGSDTCAVCGGSGYSGGYACMGCGGAGSIRCGSCGGSGYSGYCTSCKNGKVTCKTCNGRRRLYKGVAGRVSVNSRSYIEHDENSPLNSKDRNSARWICAQADGCERLSSKVIEGSLNVKWRLSVSKPYVRYQVGAGAFTSEVEGKSMATLWHGRFLDQALEPVLKKATELYRARVESEEKLKQVCDELRSGKLSTEVFRLSAGRHRDASRLGSELKGSVTNALLTEVFEFGNKVVGDIAERSGRKWLHRGCLIIGFGSILVLALDGWTSPSRWLLSWFGFNLNPVGSMTFFPMMLTGVLASVIGLRTSFASKRLTGFHVRPRRLSRRTKLHLLFGAFGTVVFALLLGIAVSVFSK